MVMFGPMQMFVFGFPGNDFNGMIYPAFDEAKEEGDNQVCGLHARLQGRGRQSSKRSRAPTWERLS